MIEAYPLQWPVGYKRSASQKSSPFKQTPDKAQRFLRDELYRMGARGLIVSSNVPVKKDGSLYSDLMSSVIPDAGVAIYFEYKGKKTVMCCDKYQRVWENIYALGKGIEALRGMDRWGVSEFMDRAFTGFKALPESTDTSSWYDILGIDKMANADKIKEAYRKMAQVHHPDTGGSVDMFNKVNKAYQQGLQSLLNKN